MFVFTSTSCLVRWVFLLSSLGFGLVSSLRPHEKTADFLQQGSSGRATKGRKLQMMTMGGSSGKNKRRGDYFQRVASFPVCSQIDPNCNDDTETAADIVDVSEDGMKLVYTDGSLEAIGWIDITDPRDPKGLGYLLVPGEPNSVGVVGNYAILVINTSEDFVQVSGLLQVYDMTTQELVVEFPLPGQPNSVVISPDKTRAMIAIENERDEDLGDGGLPQFPAGTIVVVDISHPNPTQWVVKDPIDITGLPGVAFPEDPEPEFISINQNNIAVVTLQENNALVLIDAVTSEIISSFSAGSVDLKNVDLEDDELILPVQSQDNVPREMDGVAWLGNGKYFVTADGGDLIGGTRSFTVWDAKGKVLYSSGSSLEHLLIQAGHYNDGRSDVKGNEPENVAFGRFGSEDLAFVNSERSSIVFVYDVKDPSKPELVQMLPVSIRPEALKPIPSRNLLIAAGDDDSRDDGFRSHVCIYEKGYEEPSYPMMLSENKGPGGTPIPFSALSSLAAPKCSGGSTRYRHLMDDDCDSNILYTTEDSAYKKSRIFAIDTSTMPAYTVTDAWRIMDTDGVFAERLTQAGYGDLIPDLINDDLTTNLDPEGIAVAQYGGFWLASEGDGNAPAINMPNLILRLDEDAIITDAIFLPDEVNAKQVDNGFEGVTEDGQYVVVAFQAPLQGEINPRIGMYDTITQTWSFLYYPLDKAESQAGGFVGLSDIEAVGNGQFLVLERDNKAGPDAAIKRIYLIGVNEAQEELSLLRKVLVVDLMSTLKTATNGPVIEKIEGLAVDSHGNLWINNDNDGVDDNSGEQILLNLGVLQLDRPGCSLTE